MITYESSYQLGESAGVLWAEGSSASFCCMVEQISTVQVQDPLGLNVKRGYFFVLEESAVTGKSAMKGKSKTVSAVCHSK